MKVLFSFSSLLVAAAMFMVFSCQKEAPDIMSAPAGIKDGSAASSIKTDLLSQKQKEFDFKGALDFYYTFVPDIGWQGSVAPGWAPGGGVGEMSHFGRMQVRFNQYDYFASFNPLIVKSRNAPVDISVEGGFYPKDSLGGIEIPAELKNDVSIIFFDKQKNSIMAMQNADGLTFIQQNDSLITFTCTYLILHGTEKYAGASGQFVVDGRFDPRISHDGANFGYETRASMVVRDGKINYYND